jgi:uncharacterized protein (TIGR02147 family)
MNKSLFEFSDYKLYLSQVLETTGAKRGARSRLAEALGCQTAFISQVLNGKIHFSLEHSVKISEFIGLSTDESHFFMLLVHLGRAGTKALQFYYQQQIDEVQRKRQFIRERIQIKQTLSKEDQAAYYSSWIYAAIHVLLSVPKFQTRIAVADHLRLSPALVSECLDFLVSLGLATRQGEQFKIGTARIHLGQDSPLISKHHTNWRMKAIQSLDAPPKGDLHYSSVISLAENDAKRVRGMLLEVLEKTEPILKDSKEEAVFSMCIDLFRI